MAAFSTSAFDIAAFDISAFDLGAPLVATGPDLSQFGDDVGHSGSTRKKKKREPEYQNWNAVIWPSAPQEHPAVLVPVEAVPSAPIKQEIVTEIRRAAKVSTQLVRELARELKTISDATEIQRWAQYQNRRLRELEDEEALFRLGVFN